MGNNSLTTWKQLKGIPFPISMRKQIQFVLLQAWNQILAPSTRGKSWGDTGQTRQTKLFFASLERFFTQRSRDCPAKEGGHGTRGCCWDGSRIMSKAETIQAGAMNLCEVQQWGASQCHESFSCWIKARINIMEWAGQSPFVICSSQNPTTQGGIPKQFLKLFDKTPQFLKC